MVAVSKGDDVEVARVEPGHVHRQVVGLGPAVDKVDAFQGVGQQCRQSFSIFVDFRLQRNNINSLILVLPCIKSSFSQPGFRGTLGFKNVDLELL